jgi:DinB superfamily
MSELTKQAIYDELAAAQATFRQLFVAMTADDLERRSNGTRWTNREMLFHMLFGYFVVRALLPMVKAFGYAPRPVSRGFAAILNAGTRPFHPINYFGSWAGGRLLSPASMQRRFDRVTQKLARQLARESARSLARGMYFPPRWDPFFKPYMTLREVYHYPTQHFEFHRGQLALRESKSGDGQEH